MNKVLLLKSAEELKKVSEKSYKEYAQKADLMVSDINSIMLQRPDLEALVGINNIEMMKDNHANHVRFIASVLKNPNSEVLVETILWVFRAYRTHGFSTNYWASQLNAWIAVLKKNLSDEAFWEITPYYEWMQVNIPVFVKISEDDINLSKSLH